MPPWVSDEVPIRLTVFCAAFLLPALIRLTDEQFNAETAPGQWTYRAVAKHVLSPEQDSLEVGDMTISAQIAVYPLRQERLTPAVDAVRTALTAKGLAPQIGPMSTMVAGEAGTVFAALGEAFERAAAAGHVVMTITVSNACPVAV